MSLIIQLFKSSAVQAVKRHRNGCLSHPVLFQPGTWFPVENCSPGAILKFSRTTSFESVFL